ncbi:hypothetical protein N7528_004874 [Penicillium herquei]|nr:hypothetical protein N7528_004874 [Penicillium herquei]
MAEMTGHSNRSLFIALLPDSEGYYRLNMDGVHRIVRVLRAKEGFWAKKRRLVAYNHVTRGVLPLSAPEAFMAEAAMNRAVHADTAGEFIGLVRLWTSAQSARLLARRKQL